ncbi:conserved hypothetical protein [Ricinus communis]|uniref:Uncharacterized protein n=1 Tax=Ricinus communis TaxID=3988 RepID=B9TQJ8_RICCO|nr:conserved hypothetical protein [Ricinus communis]
MVSINSQDLRDIQVSRAGHGHVLRRQVALRPGQEGPCGGAQRGAARGREGGRPVPSVAAGPGHPHLRPHQDAGHGPAFS